MLYVLDTSTFSDLVRDHPGTQAHLRRLPEEDRASLCPVVVGEVLYGLGRLPDGARRRALEQKASRLIAALSHIPIPPEAAEHYARIKLGREAIGQPLDENDCWIAATALAHGAVLVTRDNDFAQTPGLRLEDWSAGG